MKQHIKKKEYIPPITSRIAAEAFTVLAGSPVDEDTWDAKKHHATFEDLEEEDENKYFGKLWDD